MAVINAGHKKLAALPNLVAFGTLVQRVVERPIELEKLGLAVFSGPSGFGKSDAALYAQLRFNAIAVEVKDSWRKVAFCKAILKACEVKPKGTTSELIDQICTYLARTDRPLIIDEADVALKHNMIETIREIFLGSFVPVIMIGEENFPQDLQHIERVHGRVMEWVQANPGSMSDLELLLPIYCKGTKISPHLKEEIFKQSRGSIRRISDNLVKVEQLAITKGLSEVCIKDLGSLQLSTGIAPSSRNGLHGEGFINAPEGRK